MIILAYLIISFTLYDPFFFAAVEEWQEPSRFFFSFFAVMFLIIDILLIMLINDVFGKSKKAKDKK